MDEPLYLVNYSEIYFNDSNNIQSRSLVLKCKRKPQGLEEKQQGATGDTIQLLLKERQPADIWNTAEESGHDNKNPLNNVTRNPMNLTKGYKETPPFPWSQTNEPREPQSKLSRNGLLISDDLETNPREEPIGYRRTGPIIADQMDYNFQTDVVGKKSQGGTRAQYARPGPFPLDLCDHVIEGQMQWEEDSLDDREHTERISRLHNREDSTDIHFQSQYTITSENNTISKYYLDDFASTSDYCRNPTENDVHFYRKSRYSATTTETASGSNNLEESGFEWTSNSEFTLNNEISTVDDETYEDGEIDTVNESESITDSQYEQFIHYETVMGSWQAMMAAYLLTLSNGIVGVSLPSSQLLLY
ncbi:unnamed protein product [Owenia fusiformis]|uniref:Uncharacterized protein n=1 Tax=Owenia fusiformis TaxID=6347 RepID=A0A8S4P2M9_OWEFU|nr:unnamed protein product [Owenia fusiformis]